MSIFNIERNGNTFSVFCDGALFTKIVYDDNCIRPYMGPVYAADGTEFTRAYKKAREHPHQRSLFVGIGNVNGTDFWNEPRLKNRTNGEIKLVSATEPVNGERATISITSVWQKPDGEKVIDETRTFAFSKDGENVTRVDLTIEFTASYGKVEFGKTKEAGPLGIRVTKQMTVDKKGRFTNSEGGVNEEGCWGKPAAWCNYMAELHGRKMGIAAFDRKTNERFPTCWHVRNYGLMAANNLNFKGGLTIENNKMLRYDFTVCFWENSIDESRYCD